MMRPSIFVFSIDSAMFFLITTAKVRKSSVY